MAFYVAVLLTLVIGGEPVTRWSENRMLEFATEEECRKVLASPDREALLRSSIATQFEGREFTIQKFDCLTLEKVAELNAALEGGI